MNCWYCLDKIAGMRKMMALTVVYENGQYPSRSLRTMNNVHHPKFYERAQTEMELSCAKTRTRIFSTYSYFFKEYVNANELVNYCVLDDDFLKLNEAEAIVFKDKFLKEVERIYKTDFQFRKKSKFRKNNQLLMELAK